MEIRKKIVKLKNVTQIPLYDSFISRDGDKLITRDGDYLTWLKIVSAYATDASFDGTAFSFIEHYRLSNNTEAAFRRTYNRFVPTVEITSAPTEDIVSSDPTAWTSSILGVSVIGENLYENYEGWSVYEMDYAIAAGFVNTGVTYGVTARASMASRAVYRDAYLSISIPAQITPSFSTTVGQTFNAALQVYSTDLYIHSIGASNKATVNVYNRTAISDFPTEWGKLINVQHTVTPDESRGSWTYIVALSFENRFLPIRVYRNGTVVVDTNSSFSYQADLNCAVYADQSTWVASRAVNSPDAGAMVWYNAAGIAKRALDYVTATAQGWNDGHNTIQNFATTSNISNNVLNIYLWGNQIASYRVLT